MGRGEGQEGMVEGRGRKEGAGRGGAGREGQVGRSREGYIVHLHKL